MPERFEEIVNRALEKDRDKRYPSAAALRTDLELLAKSLEAQTAATDAAIPRKPIGRARWAMVAIIVVAIAASGLWWRSRSGQQPFKDFTITQITSNGRAEQAAVSPDGKYILHVNNDNGIRSLRLRNVATGSDTETLAAAATRFKCLAFSPDGNYVYFRQQVNSSGSEWDEFRMPVLGGTPQLVARDVDSNLAFSPDGKRMSYVRANDPEEGKYQILASDLDGSGEKLLSSQKIEGFGHDAYPPNAAWSPDGKQIAFTFSRMADEPGILRRLDVETRNFGVLQHFPQQLTFEIQWTPRQDWLLLLNSPTGGDSGLQISAFSLRDRQLHPITRDTNSYASLTLSADGKTAVAVQDRSVSSLSIIEGSPRVTAANFRSLENVSAFDWIENGRLLVSDGSKLSLEQGDATTELAVQSSGSIMAISSCSTGDLLVNWEHHAGNEGSTIWRINADGSQATPLSKGKYDMSPACSPDGKWAYYLDGMQGLMRVPVQGGEPELFPMNIPNLDRVHGTVAFSPDGRQLVAVVDVVDPVSNHAEPRLALFDAAPTQGAYAPRLLVPDPRIFPGSLHSGGARFTPDGKSLVYAIREKGVGNLWVQPLDGTPGHALTDFTSDLISQFRFSPDGKRVAVKRTHTTADVVLLRDTSH